MRRSLPRSLGIGAIAGGMVAAPLLAVASVPPAAAQGSVMETASILPCADCTLSSAPGNAAGYDLAGSGITDYWQTAKQGTIDFVFFVDPGQQVTQDISFSLWPPGTASSPIAQYTFKNTTIPPEGLWFQVPAQGDYSQPGIYTAEVQADRQEIGHIPVVVANFSTADQPRHMLASQMSVPIPARFHRGPAGSAPASGAEQAAILACANCTVTSDLGHEGGYILTGSGITDEWLAAKQGSIDFVFFVDPGRPLTQDITFALWGPGTTQQPLSEYTFTHARIPLEGLWFQVPAQGDYAQPGVYTAAVYANGSAIGYIPVVLVGHAPASPR